MYSYAEAKKGLKFSELTESEQNYIRVEWEKQKARKNVNNSEYIYIQIPETGFFFKAERGRICASRYSGSAGGYWRVTLGNFKGWKFSKSPLGGYYPESAIRKYNRAQRKEDGTIIEIPFSVHTKKDALELAKLVGFKF